jgi:glycine oxidase
LTDPTPSVRSVDVAVVGAGIIGLGIAWTVWQTGRTVAIIDAAPASGATEAAAGMLAPVSELHYQEEHLLELMLASSALYPAFIELLGASGVEAGYQRTRTINVGADAADRRALADLREVQLSHGLAVDALTIREARELEPLLSPQLSSASSISQDHQVDPRRLAATLIAALAATATATPTATARGSERDPFIRQNASTLLHRDPADNSSRVTGVQLADGSAVEAAEVIVATGLAAARLGGLPDGLRLPLRPVYGDIIRLRVPESLRPLLTATIRGVVRGVPVYLVPREDGTIVIGATAREDGSAGISAGGIHQLLRDAQVLVPAVAELEIIEVMARARPGTPDNAPLLGRVRGTSDDQTSEADAPVPGLIIATGFFRHGVLLMPVAAKICADLLDGVEDPRWEPFAPDRFSPSSHTLTDLPAPIAPTAPTPQTAKATAL